MFGLADIAGSSPATAGQATDLPTLTASLTPTTFAPGADMTYSSVGPCPEVEGVRLFYAVWNEGDITGGAEDALPVSDGYAEVEQDGSWTTTVPAPADGGQYEIVGSCVTGGQDPDVPLPEGGVQVHAQYSAIGFDVIPDLSEDPSTNTPSTNTRARPSPLARSRRNRPSRVDQPQRPSCGSVSVPPPAQGVVLGIEPRRSIRRR